jgi:hypothetical protein
MTNRKTDFNFTTDGYSFRIMPNNPQAQENWNMINEAFPGGVIPRSAWASVKYQLKQAGYSVRKEPKVKNVDLDALLAELGA